MQEVNGDLLFQINNLKHIIMNQHEELSVEKSDTIKRST